MNMDGLVTLIPVIRFGLVILAVITAATFFAPNWWFTDLLKQFTVQYALVSLLTFLLLLGFKYLLGLEVQRYMLVLCVFLFALHGYVMSTFLLQRSQTAVSDSVVLRVMSLNMLYKNRGYDKILAHVESAKPDLLLLIELQPHHVEGLEVLKSTYPHHEITPAHDSFGMALFSKHPLSKLQTHFWGERRIPYIQASLNMENAPEIDFYGVHLRPPVTKEFTAINVGQATDIMKAVTSDKPTIIAGDFNNTPWTTSYKQMLAPTNLVNASSSYGLGTWMPHLLGGLLIDHIFVQQLGVVHWEMGPNVGSDHRSVIADISIAK